MVTLTAEQRDVLILIGKSDDGSQDHLVVDGERIIRELMGLGIVHYTGKDLAGKDSYDLTHAGERLYGVLTGENVD